MTAGWGQRTLRMRLAAWYAGAGVVILVTCLMAGLMTGIWTPSSRVDVLIVLLAGLPGAACAFAVAGYLVAGRALAPLAIMAERAKRLSATSLSERLPVLNAGDELGQLAGVFNELLGRLEASFVELRRFTADASHELRTPLTAIRAVGEVGLQQGDERGLRDAVGSILEETDRLNQLIDGLLLLAKADNEVASARVVVAPIAGVVEEVTDLLRLVAEENGQTLDTTQVQDVAAVMDTSLLRLALMNLVQNAIRYGPPNTPIRIRAFASAGDAIIEVIDAGPGISRLHHAKVFERFYRVDKSRSRPEGGTGLGLAIVKWAAERMSGSVELESEPRRGSVFRVRLPRAGGLPGGQKASYQASEAAAYDREPGTTAHPPATGSHTTPTLSHGRDEVLPELFADSLDAAHTPLNDVLARLRTQSDGLSWGEAQRRLDHYGTNEALANRAPSWISLLWHAGKNPFNGVLVLLGVVSLVAGDMKAAAVMTVMVVLSTALRFQQEWKSLVQAESLRRLVRNTVTVHRVQNEAVPDRIPSSINYDASDIPLEQLVPGDIVLLSAGDMIPADLLLLESRDLFVTQSTLTGEAMPLEKGTAIQEPESIGSGIESTALDNSRLLFMGSSVISGAGRAVVLVTGPRTYLAGMAAHLANRRTDTAFDRGVDQVSWLLVRFMLAMVPIVFFINGLSKGRWTNAFFFAVAVAVGLTPEMLPMIVNANLARGAVALARRKIIVKQLSAIQNLGAMDVLCTDKTGTLTRDHVVLMKHIDYRGQDSARVLEHAYLNSAFQTGLKNLLDVAIAEQASAQGVRDLQRSFKKIDEIPFDFARRRMSVVLQQAGGINVLYCKGAVEEMLQICSQVDKGDGIDPLTQELREQLKRLRDELNEDGMRVVAVGYKAIDLGSHPFRVEDETGLIFSGFLTFVDPPKEHVFETLRRLRQQDIVVKILTGDNAAVARRVCNDVGLDPGEVVTGTEIESLPEEALCDLAGRTTVFAKLSPIQKSRIVKALKSRGHTVGFMGDGINDALALREADVGISVDSAVDVAKEAADLILLEKSLLVLERGVLEGRRTFGNIIKYIKMTASSNFGNVLSVLIASAVLPFLPMLPIQLLVQNLLYDLSQTTIPWDRMDEDFVKRPRQWEARSIATFMLCIGPISSLFDIIMFALLWYVLGANSPSQQTLFQSGWFVEALLTQVLIVHMLRTEQIPFVQSTATWPVLLLTGLVMVCGVWLPFSPLAPALKMQGLPLAYFPWLIVILISYCVLTQLLKRAYIRRFGKWL